MPGTSKTAVAFRNVMWKAWENSVFSTPATRGHYRSAAVLRRLIGLPVRPVSGVLLELFPASSADQWIASTMQGRSAVHSAIDEFLTPGDVFLDVGANIGLFSILAAVKHGAEVHAVEPSPRELRRLERNVKLNRARVNVLPVALGAFSGEASFYLDAADSHMTNRIVHRPGEGNVKCPVRRLGDVMDESTLRRCRLVKIDVEGNELEVLQGMESSLGALRQAAFVLEVTPRWLQERGGTSAERLYGHLVERGWRPRGVIRVAEQWDEIFVPAHG